MTPIDEYNSVVDNVEDHIEKAEISHERTKHSDREEDDYDSITFRFLDDAETDFYVGIRSDSRYAECIWEFDLIPALGNQLEDEEPSRIIPREDLPTESTEEMHGIQSQMINILDGIETGDIPEEVTESSLGDRIEEDGKEKLREDLKDALHELTAAQQALDSLSEDQTLKITHQLDRILKSGSFNYAIDLTDDNKLRGFNIRSKFFPYDSLSTREFYEEYTAVKNYGKYSERFLKMTFDIEDGALSWNSENESISKNIEQVLSQY